MLGIGRFSGRSAAAVIVIVIIRANLFFAEMALQRNVPPKKDKLPKYFFGGNVAAPEADFR